MFTAPIPPVQGLAYQSHYQNPLDAVHDAYGVWYGAMQYDPTGNLVRAAIYNSLWTGAVFAALGHYLPGYNAKEGAKWGALVGAGLTVVSRGASSVLR